MPEIQEPGGGPESDQLTLAALQQNFEQLALSLEQKIPDFEDCRFECLMGYVPEMIDLLVPTTKIYIWSKTHWLSIILAKSRLVTIDEVMKWWDEYKDPRETRENRARFEGVIKQSKATSQETELSLEELGL